VYLAHPKTNPDTFPAPNPLPLSPFAGSGQPDRYGISQVIDPIRRAVKDDRVTGLARALMRLDAAGAFDRPGLFVPGIEGHYARQLVWKDADAGFVVIAMTWLPGQASPLHDHAGMWGAEIVVAGTMHETTFRLVDRDASGRYKFVREQERTVARGAVGILIPPLEYHSFGNHGTTTAHTLHVYSGELEACQSFAADSDGWWSARKVDLRYDA
jgi:3-mercaptopropionate dioxygenase